jgi:pyruvate kinase
VTKIERSGVDALDDIIAEAALMVARGDLGVEIGPEMVRPKQMILRR